MGPQASDFQKDLMECLKKSDYPYDKLMGSFGKKYVVMLQRALWNAGLTTAYIPMLQLGSIGAEIDGLGTFAAIFYNNPWFDKYDFTTPSPESKNILYPTAERAIIESILFVEHCDEGILLESLKNYYDREQSWGKLYEILPFFHIGFKSKLDYWINEAENYDILG